ncbi:hypothetical protein [Leifsonia sp. Root4]|uniref:hypothetical protein n=1 Tax=Leifsonia sp. Root4 TaxID=1736525 RepID=UPI000AE9204A|nr:hypothetical protein [Leifsonia sp. Root4]
MTVSERQLRRDELLERSLALAARLKRALDAFDGGALDAAEDVSAYTRTLLASGQGNMVISRLCREHSLPLPQLAVSAPPAKAPSVFLSIGLLPTGEDSNATEHRGISKVIGFRSLVESPAVESNATQRTSNSWGYVANQFGNTWGSHISTTVPELFSRFAMFDSVGITLREYAVRQLGWLAEEALRQTLSSHDSSLAAATSTRGVDFRGLTITHLTVARSDPGAPFDIAPQFSLTHINEPSTIINYEHDGYRTWLGFKDGYLRIEGNVPQGQIGKLAPRISFSSVPGTKFVSGAPPLKVNRLH